MSQKRERSGNDLTELPNIGRVLADELRDIGIDTPNELAKIGSVEAAARIARGRRGACHNLLLALEGAIRSVRWHSIPEDERNELSDALDRRRREG